MHAVGPIERAGQYLVDVRWTAFHRDTACDQREITDDPPMIEQFC